jgi:hypothetical protein
VPRQRYAALLTVLCTVIAMCSCSTVQQTDVSPLTCPSGEIVGWGDSLTLSMISTNGGVPRQADPTWLDTLGDDLNVHTENFGVSAHGSAEIAVRQGGLKPLLTLDGNQIAPFSSSAIAVSAIIPADGWTRYGNAQEIAEVHGTLAGVAGTLRHSLPLRGSESFSFIPDVAPTSVVLVPANSTFSSDDGDRYRGCFQIIWAGTNNRDETAAIERDIDSMVRRIANPKRYLVVGTIQAVEDQLSATYGRRFTDLRGWLISDGLTAVGVTATPTDIAAVRAGKIPPSLLSDEIHFTQAAYTAIGHHLASIIKILR